MKEHDVKELQRDVTQLKNSLKELDKGQCFQVQLLGAILGGVLVVLWEIL